MKSAASPYGPTHLENIYINQESDIVMILSGLQCIINTCLDIKEGSLIEEDINEDELNEEEQIRIGKLNKNDANKNKGFFNKVFGGSEATFFAPDAFADVRIAIHRRLSDILISCIYCWNHLEFFNWSDYHFTRHGMFQFYNEDGRKIVEKMRIKRKIQK